MVELIVKWLSYNFCKVEEWFGDEWILELNVW